MSSVLHLTSNVIQSKSVLRSPDEQRDLAYMQGFLANEHRDLTNEQRDSADRHRDSASRQPY